MRSIAQHYVVSRILDGKPENFLTHGQDNVKINGFMVATDMGMAT